MTITWTPDLTAAPAKAGSGAVTSDTRDVGPARAGSLDILTPRDGSGPAPFAPDIEKSNHTNHGRHLAENDLPDRLA